MQANKGHFQMLLAFLTHQQTPVQWARHKLRPLKTEITTNCEVRDPLIIILFHYNSSLRHIYVHSNFIPLILFLLYVRY